MKRKIISFNTNTIMPIRSLQKILRVANASPKKQSMAKKASFAIRTTNPKRAKLLARRESNKRNKELLGVKRLTKGIFLVKLKTKKY